MARWFARFASRMAEIAGHCQTFLAAILVIVVWAATGPFFGFSDTWQLVINTGTTVVTFLMVFVIQNTQNRDARAMHLKLDELIRSQEAADNAIIRAEDETDEELAELKHRYEALGNASQVLRAGLAPEARNGASPVATDGYGRLPLTSQRPRTSSSVEEDRLPYCAHAAVRHHR